MQADQGIAEIAEDFVYLLDQPLEIRVGGEQGRQLKPEEGDRLAGGVK